MRNFGKLVLAATSALSLAAAAGASVLAHEDHQILHFDSMTPVTGSAVGTVNDRGLTGGGKAWVISSGTGTVDSAGHVQASVTGLVIPALGGINPIASFKAVVSCVTRHHAIVNVSTGLFPASAAGDSTIDDMVALPHPCVQPIVFVTSAGGSWFAMSNASDDEEDGD